MRSLALKIDVDTLRGTEQGVPHLTSMLARHGAGGTFLFSLGPDHTGRAVRRAFRRGFAAKVARTSVLEHYGLRTLLYGTLLPGPDIGRRAAAVMRTVAAAGFETGVHTWDHVAWQDHLAHASRDWVEDTMRRACERYGEIFGTAPRAYGAAGWQTSARALRATDRAGFDYASDCRGERPFLPILKAEPFDCPQLPTTLPTLDELIGLDGVDVGNVAAALLARTQAEVPCGHVFTLHAELEGMRLSTVLEQLLVGWRGQGYRLVSMREHLALFDLSALPRCSIEFGEIAGRTGTLALQGGEFLAAA